MGAYHYHSNQSGIECYALDEIAWISLFSQVKIGMFLIILLMRVTCQKYPINQGQLSFCALVLL